MLKGSVKGKSLAIVPIKPKHSYEHPKVSHPVLPQHEFSMLIVAPKGSGKTNLICNLLLNHYKGYFHQILVCSPTVENDPKWEVVKATKGLLVENKQLNRILGEKIYNGKKPIPKVVHKSEGEAIDEMKEGDDNKFDGRIPESAFFTDMDELPQRLEKQNETMRKLRELGYEERAKYLIDRILVIEDDQAGLYKGGNNNNKQVNLVFKHRHYGCSLIKVTQAYKAIPKSIRTNMNALVCFEIPNQAELDVIYEEWPMYLKYDDWMKMFEFATQDNFSFIYMNNHFKKGERVYKNFEYRITLEDVDSPRKKKSRTDGGRKSPVEPAAHPTQ